MGSRVFFSKPSQSLWKQSHWLDGHDKYKILECDGAEYPKIKFCIPAPSDTGAAQDQIRVIDIPNDWRQAEEKADSSDLPDELPQTTLPDENVNPGTSDLRDDDRPQTTLQDVNVNLASSIKPGETQNQAEGCAFV